MKIALIGAGNVASHLGPALLDLGHQINSVWSRSTENAQILAKKVRSQAIVSLKDIPEDTDLCMLLVSDTAIEDVASQLNLTTKTLLVHASGTVPLDVISNFANRTAVFYPMHAFQKDASSNLSKMQVFIEAGEKRDETILRDLAKSLVDESRVHLLNSQQRKVLHLAAVFACNFTNHMYYLAEKIGEEQSINPNWLNDLVESTSANAIKNGALKSQTGPAKRNDKATMEEHLQMLQSNPKAAEIYRLVSESITKTYS